MNPASRADADQLFVDRRFVLRGLGSLAGAAGAAGLLAGCGSGGLGGVPATPMQAAASSLDPYFLGYGAGGFVVDRYALELEFSSDLSTLSGIATIQIMPYAALSGLSLDLHGPRARSVRINGRSAVFTQLPTGKLHLTAPGVLSPGAIAILEIGYTAQRAPVSVPDVGPAGWQQTTAGGPAVTVLSLPVGASTWYPCVDHPSAKAAYDFTVTAPSRFSVLANGRLVGKTGQGARTSWSYHHPGPMAGYLASVQIGEFELAGPQNGQGQDQGQSAAPAGILIRNGYPSAMAAAAEYDLGRQGRMISLFSELFGPYPFDVYGALVVTGLPGQGGRSAEDPVRLSFGAQTLGLIDAGLIDGRRTNENQLANAVARQWFGAGVSVSDWSQFWLSESFAKYAEWLWAERTGGGSARGSAVAAMTQLRALAQDLIVSDPGAQRLLDLRVALRGACYLQELRQAVGDTVFFQILQVWCNRGQAGTGSTADFLQLIPQVYTASDLSQLGFSWLDLAALPELT
jgi:aminopeptidase N